MIGQRREVVEILRCSFCRKNQDQVDALISNPSDHLRRVHICDECVEVCNSVLEDHRKQKSASALPAFAR
jgi:ATP-dependent protease Clp ATPase subunit